MDDLIKGFAPLLDPGVETFPLDIGNPDERLILELPKIIIELADSPSDVTFEPPQPQDPLARRPDIKKARSELDWEPSVGLRKGLRRTIEHFERDLSE